MWLSCFLGCFSIWPPKIVLLWLPEQHKDYQPEWGPTCLLLLVHGLDYNPNENEVEEPPSKIVLLGGFQCDSLWLNG